MPVRDTLFLLDAPFDGARRKLAELPVRFSSLKWGNGRLAWVEEERWKDRKRLIQAISPDTPGPLVTLFEGSFEDRYHDPGRPFETTNAAGKRVLQTTTDSSAIYLRGEGASPDGDRPFVSVMSASNGETKKLWQSTEKFYEYAAALLDADGPTILLRRESPELHPNYYIKTFTNDELKQVTFFPSPYGEAKLPKKQVLKYKRADGVDLSANLYLPPGYKPEDGPLPTLMEAYPDGVQDKICGRTDQRLALPVSVLVLGFTRSICDSGLCRAGECHHSHHRRRRSGTERYLRGATGGERARPPSTKARASESSIAAGWP